MVRATFPARGLLLLLILAATVLAGCSSGQTLVVTTNPPGAEVYIKRAGHIEYKGDVAGVVGTERTEGHFEEPDFQLIGNGPLEYKFALTRSEKSTAMAGVASEETTYVYDWGVIRVVAPGYKRADRRVEFTGDKLDLNIQLQPDE